MPNEAGDNGGRRPQLLLGPMLRYVDERRATVWFETDGPCRVEVVVERSHHADGRHGADTWSVHGHHYALVRIEDLAPDTHHEYAVELDGHRVWPLADSPYPPSVIRTPNPAGPFRVAFGSCRRSAPFDDEYLASLGADALVALADRMASVSSREWPEILLLLGDQVYADDPSDAIVDRLRHAHARNGAERDDDIRDEIQNYEEYTWLYHETWTPLPVRWLLSTVPTAMLLDDHDLRDDWNTSLSWRREVTAQPWWKDRVIGAYGSYWVYQHLGNLSPEQLDTDEVYARLMAFDDDEERTRALDQMAWDADVDASTIRWSYYRDLGVPGRAMRLVAIDSRCSRHLDPADRRMVDDAEWSWVREEVLRPEHSYDHLVLASTLPFLMVPGIHHLEEWDEAIAQGAWGRPGKWVGERLRQALDLEHWPSFRASFDEFATLLGEVVTSERPPATVLMVSGDVHCSYTARAELRDVGHPGTAVHQLTMSPFRNDIERVAKAANRLLDRRRPAGALRRLARWAGVAAEPMAWQVDHGPWFDNGVMTIEFAGRRATLDVDHAHLRDGRQELSRTVDLDLTPAKEAADAAGTEPPAEPSQPTPSPSPSSP